MYRYLSIVAADTDDVGLTPLNVTPQKVMTEEGNKTQIIHTADDGSEERISLSSNSIFYVTLQWDTILNATAAIISDYYHDVLKGNGKVRSFPWIHPTDSRIYVVRFDSSLSKKTNKGRKRSITNIKFRVLGLYQ